MLTSILTLRTSDLVCRSNGLPGFRAERARYHRRRVDTCGHRACRRGPRRFPGRRTTGKRPMVVACRSSLPSFDRLRPAAREHRLVLAAFTEVPKPPHGR
jgi:hypothetical protein